MKVYFMNHENKESIKEIHQKDQVVKLIKNLISIRVSLLRLNTISDEL